MTSTTCIILPFPPHYVFLIIFLYHPGYYHLLCYLLGALLETMLDCHSLVSTCRFLIFSRHPSMFFFLMMSFWLWYWRLYQVGPLLVVSMNTAAHLPLFLYSLIHLCKLLWYFCLFLCCKKFCFFIVYWHS